MALGVYVVALGLVAFVLVYGRRLWEAWQRRQRLVSAVDAMEGPPALPLVGNTLQFRLDRVGFSYQLEELCARYGTKKGLFRMWIGPHPIVALTKARTAEPILKSSELITKSFLGYYYLREWVGDGLLLSTGRKWQSRRKMLTPAFHYGILQGFVDIQAEQAAALVENLRPKAAAGLPFDIFPFIGRCALDIICDAAMGVTVGAQKEKESAYVKAVIAITEMIFKRERMPWLWLAPVWKGLGYAKEWDEAYNLLTGFTKRVIRERKAALTAEAAAKGVPLAELRSDGDGKGKKQAFLDMLIVLQAAKSELSDGDIAEEVDVFMFEGHDTTSSGMGWTLFILGHHEEEQRRVQEELDAIFGDDHERSATMEDLAEMRYLERVIKEAMRLYPPVPLFARKVSEDFMADGQLVPKGATAMVLPYMLHRDPDEYGDDADEFRPDRFLPDAAAARHPYSYIPFSAGPRNCIGQKFALMEEKAVLSRLLRSFSVKSMEDPWTVRPIPDIILRPAERFLVKLTKRH